MAKPNPPIDFRYDQENHCYQCDGFWSVLKINDYFKKFDFSTLPEEKTVKISGKTIRKFDSSGALALMHCIERLKAKGKEVELIDFNAQQLDLLKLVEEKKGNLDYQKPKIIKHNALYRIGESAVEKIHQADGFIVLLGDLTAKFFEAIGYWRRFQFPSIVSNIYSTGIQALPILALLSFLIGVVLAYQMGLQLETYGANIFIAYLSGLAIFREFAPLITAIIVAGRTSSAFTAQIGSMKINEEIDALLTMGFSPIEFLVMPKVIALLIIFPLLIFWSNVFSIIGSMIMSKWMLNVGYLDFLERLREMVGFKEMMLGLYKAPAFAIIISFVGCYQGFGVEPSGEATIGSQTTRAVVQALFLIIVADAVYSIIYSWMGI